MPKDLYGAPKVGGDILSFCTRCKMELAHVIVAMVRERPARVLCKTCRTQHAYRRQPSDSPVRASPGARARPAPKTGGRAADLWEKKIAERAAAPTAAYSVRSRFQQGDVIQHAQFGMGIVEEVRDRGKITVLFRDGERTLVHGLETSVAAG